VAAGLTDKAPCGVDGYYPVGDFSGCCTLGEADRRRALPTQDAFCDDDRVARDRMGEGK